jgi:hypothetical protein
MVAFKVYLWPHGMALAVGNVFEMATYAEATRI